MKSNFESEMQIMDAVKKGIFRITKSGEIWRGSRRAEHRTPQGYLQVRWMRNKIRAACGAHRIVYRSMVGDIPPGLTVNHRNGIKDDNRPENLELATFTQQSMHSLYVLGKNSHLLNQDGEKNHNAKLNDSEVEAMRKEYSESVTTTQAMLAVKYGVSFKTVSKIVRGNRRRSSPGPVANYACKRFHGTHRDSKGQFSA